jgi:hypothetical protein
MEVLDTGPLETLRGAVVDASDIGHSHVVGIAAISECPTNVGIASLVSPCSGKCIRYGECSSRQAGIRKSERRKENERRKKWLRVCGLHDEH